ncbi:MAG: thioredoxin fold domain-containing protein [Hydrogenophaga sp.]|uniref:thioredoxin fold domain-containing protein n=1 Tax=Hydrogenophaga sp. TaxID=1904254 RepID=UPI00272F3B98|nr:thioredoxin fold domain-containing protein [Hydrogenophaga sp.]MDP2163665.1 thioredoxin fold domain-containing protein [Hydrogenophaga sp.]MDP3475989.1 thioredoxin fold domain-containing protein [Hydrogenophaga sp.]
MTIRRLILPLVAAMALGLSACSKTDSTPTPTAETATAIAPAQAYEAVAAQAKGFTVGALMSAHTVYVLFDPQCPHCGHLWNAALPLLGKTRFVWVPVAIMGSKSMPQGAALMQAADPVAAMSAHEQSILSGQGGMSASSSIPDDVAAAIQTNTQLMDRLGAASVPFIVARHTRSGQVITRAGALSTEALSEFLGLGQP